MAIPPFTPGVPQNGSSLGVTRDPIRNNLDGTFQTIDINHYNNNDANAGKHRRVTLPRLGATPTTAALEGCLYTRTVATGTELFYVKDNTAASAVQLTGQKGAATQNSYTFLPNGLLMQWMYVATPVDNTAYNYPIPFPNAVFSIQITPVRNSNTTNSIFVKDVPDPQTTLNSVTIRSSSANFAGMFVLAIGR